MGILNCVGDAIANAVYICVCDDDVDATTMAMIMLLVCRYAIESVCMHAIIYINTNIFRFRKYSHTYEIYCQQHHTIHSLSRAQPTISRRKRKSGG